MTAAIAMPGNTAEMFLVHFFGTGLADDRYVVERFRARVDGDIVPAPAVAPAAKGRRKTKRVTATLRAVREMRPARTEIIIRTGFKTRGGMQVSLPFRAGRVHAVLPEGARSSKERATN